MRYLTLISVLFLVACDEPTVDPAFVTRMQGGAEALLISIEARDGAIAPFAAVTTNKGRTTWRSGDGVSVSTQGGLLQATRGLGADMLASDTTETDRRLRANQPGTVQRFHTFLTGEDKAQIRAYVCDIRLRGPRSVDVGRGPEPARLMAEDCVGLADSFTNLYWIAPSGDVLQSRQWAGPFTGPLAIRKLVR